MPASDVSERAAAIRRFNRFYTRQLGLLSEGHLHSPFSLTEVRVLYELAHRAQATATEIGQELGLDAGYLSRIVRGFEQRGLLARRPSETDGRQQMLRLMEQGHATFAALNARSQHQIEALLTRLSEEHQHRLVGAMREIEALLEAPPAPRPAVRIRTHQPGDLGWIVYRHGAVYAAEYGWDERFEALVAGIVAAFGAGHDPARERCWMADVGGRTVGSVMLVRESDDVARLRLLLVEPEARGLGAGTQLVDACIRFARASGYARLTLWTNDVLAAARHLYERAGFQLVKSEPHDHFGDGLVGETWELAL